MNKIKLCYMLHNVIVCFSISVSARVKFYLKKIFYLTYSKRAYRVKDIYEFEVNYMNFNAEHMVLSYTGFTWRGLWRCGHAARHGVLV